MIALLWLARVMAVAFFIGLGVQQWRMGCEFTVARIGVPVVCVLSAMWSVWPLVLVSLAGIALLVWLDRRQKALGG
jgi:hypothetical protein